jgi:hypothetical protein
VWFCPTCRDIPLAPTLDRGSLWYIIEQTICSVVCVTRHCSVNRSRLCCCFMLSEHLTCAAGCVKFHYLYRKNSLHMFLNYVGQVKCQQMSHDIIYFCKDQSLWIRGSWHLQCVKVYVNATWNLYVGNELLSGCFGIKMVMSNISIAVDLTLVND